MKVSRYLQPQTMQPLPGNKRVNPNNQRELMLAAAKRRMKGKR